MHNGVHSGTDPVVHSLLFIVSIIGTVLIENVKNLLLVSVSYNNGRLLKCEVKHLGLAPVSHNNGRLLLQESAIDFPRIALFFVL